MFSLARSLCLALSLCISLAVSPSVVPVSPTSSTISPACLQHPNVSRTPVCVERERERERKREREREKTERKRERKQRERKRERKQRERKREKRERERRIFFFGRCHSISYHNIRSFTYHNHNIILS